MRPEDQARPWSGPARETPSVDRMSIEEKVGQLVMVRSGDVEVLESMLAAGHAGSFYFGMKNRPAEAVAETLNGLQAAARHPAIVAFGSATTDCGTGLLRGRFMRVGATRSAEIAYRIGFIETSEQRAYGYHVPGMPGLDVNTNPRNPIINTRSFSDDASLVAELGAAMSRGIVDARGVTCALHFPGHGATDHDSHIEMPIDATRLEEIQRVHLAPFRTLIEAGLLNGLCTNHVYYPALDPGEPAPSTVSRRVVTELLRDELGFDGVCMSDSLTMRPMKDGYGVEESAVLAVLAGHDIILSDYQSDPRVTHQALVDAVRSGRIPESQVDASATRVLRLKQWLGLFDNAQVDIEAIGDRVAAPEHRAFAVRVAQEAVTVLENRILPLRVAPGERCLAVVNGSDAAWDADMDLVFLPSHERLLRLLRERVPDLETVALSESPAADELSRARDRAAAADVVIFGVFTRVLCYHEDSIGVPSAYADLIRDAVRMGKRVVLLNLGNPYLMAELPRADASLCTYDADCLESTEAGVAALFGDFRTTGKLPVAVSDDYPFGYGL